jgi:L-lactate dehydrogenase complex protein LldF
MKDYKHLSFSSSLCGKCTEVCPAAIKLHRLLLYNRRDSVDLNLTGKTDKLVMYGWKKIMTNRWMMDKPGAKLKNTALRVFFSRSWGSRRDIPKIKQTSFNKWWKEKNNNQ